jgi:hypothetical protein
MSEIQIPKIEKSDIVAPEIPEGGTAIVLQRHERYQRARDAENAGSIFPEDAELTRANDEAFFDTVLSEEGDSETMFLFISSDTQYAGKGRRSLETAQVAQDAAVAVMERKGIDPKTRIINFNPDFRTNGHDETGQAIRPEKKLREPKMFDETPDFVKELGKKFNPPNVQAEIDAQRTDVQLSPQAFAAYEADDPEVVKMREQHGAEGVYDILDRTKKSIRVLERYAQAFHASNPGKRLVIWGASHYDTISPLVKDATDTEFDEFVPVDYGAGVVINVPPKGEGETTLEAQGQRIALDLGRRSVKSEVTVIPVDQ